VLNNSEGDLRDLKFRVSHSEVKITDAPKEIGMHKSASLKLTWSPAITVKQALKAKLKVNGFELFK